MVTHTFRFLGWRRAVAAALVVALTFSSVFTARASQIGPGERPGQSVKLLTQLVTTHPSPGSTEILMTLPAGTAVVHSTHAVAADGSKWVVIESVDGRYLGWLTLDEFLAGSGTQIGDAAGESPVQLATTVQTRVAPGSSDIMMTLPGGTLVVHFAHTIANSAEWVAVKTPDSRFSGWITLYDFLASRLPQPGDPDGEVVLVLAADVTTHPSPGAQEVSFTLTAGTSVVHIGHALAPDGSEWVALKSADGRYLGWLTRAEFLAGVSPRI